MINGSESNNLSKVISNRGVRSILFIILVTMGIWIILGFGFMLIYEGLLFASLRLSLISKKAYSFSRVLLNQKPDNNYSIPNNSWYTKIFIIIEAIINALIMAVGIWVIIHFGIKGQNFIYLLLFGK